jgi:tetratricopeptide (TPR) repeat protein
MTTVLPRALVAALTLAAGAALANIDLPPSAADNADAMVAAEALKAGNWQQAITGFTAALKAEPDNAAYYNGLGFAYRKAGNLDASFENYRRALRIDPELRSAHEYIGEAYLAKGDKAKAREHLAVLERLCGNRNCEEYVDLAKAIAAAK